MKANVPPQLSDLAAEKGTSCAVAIREQLHPLISDKGILGAQVIFLYEADGHALAGLQSLGPKSALALLERIAEARYRGNVVTAVHAEGPLAELKKS